MKAKTPEIQWINVRKLHISNKNPRKITVEEMENLKKSISENRKFFEARPCLVNYNNSKFTVYAGNQRLAAAKELGWAAVPCIVETLTIEEERSRMLLDNTHSGIWDKNVLVEHFTAEELGKLNIGISLKETTLNFEKLQTYEYLLDSRVKNMLGVCGEVPPFNGIFLSTATRQIIACNNVILAVLENIDFKQLKKSCIIPAETFKDLGENIVYNFKDNYLTDGFTKNKFTPISSEKYPDIFTMICKNSDKAPIHRVVFDVKHFQKLSRLFTDGAVIFDFYKDNTKAIAWRKEETGETGLIQFDKFKNDFFKLKKMSAI